MFFIHPEKKCTENWVSRGHILQIYTLLELKFLKDYFKLRMNEMFRLFVCEDDWKLKIYENLIQITVTYFYFSKNGKNAFCLKSFEG